MEAAWVDYRSRRAVRTSFCRIISSWDPAKKPPCRYKGADVDCCHPILTRAHSERPVHQPGGGKFEDITTELGCAHARGKGMGNPVSPTTTATAGRIVFLANDKLTNFLFLNREGKRFEEAAFETGTALPDSGEAISGMGTEGRDLNNDGLPDIVLVALDNETFPVFRNSKAGSFANTALSTAEWQPRVCRWPHFR